MVWNTTEIAYNSTGSDRPPGRVAWRKLRASMIPTKRLIHFGDTIKHLRVLFFCKECEKVCSELFRILIQIATHRLRSHGEEGGLGMTILICITCQRLCHRKGGIFMKIDQAPQANSNCTPMSVPFCILSNCSKCWRRSCTGSG